MLRRVVRRTVSGMMAGILISVGGCVFLSCRDMLMIGQVVGAFFFSIALLCICYKGYALYTGRIVFIPERHDRETISVLFLGLLGNLLATCLLGPCLAYAIPSVGTSAGAVVSAKLEQEVLQTLIRAVMCGILMYLAVSIYRDKQSVVGILFCIPVFILAGFEHSIADVFYFAAAGSWTLESAVFLLLVLIGNTAGGMLLPLMSMLGREKSKETIS